MMPPYERVASMETEIKAVVREILGIDEATPFIDEILIKERAGFSSWEIEEVISLISYYGEFYPYDDVDGPGAEFWDQWNPPLSEEK